MAIGEDDETRLRRTAARLAGKGLMLPGDTLAARVPEEGVLRVLTLAAGTAPPQDAVRLDLAGTDPDLRRRIMAVRPDVGAILIGRQPWASALAQLGHSMPGVFDEQIRHLGLEVRRSAPVADDAALRALVADGSNAVLFNNRIWCFGMTLERLALNAELLEKCAKAYVLAFATGHRVEHIPWLVRFIASRRLRHDEAQAAAAHLRGERAVPKAGY
ncbi:hypothetical protein LXM94_15010 [Rhizobium sp. TRM95111]|uniref:hypothetical protein n=1 Tax=Rhizobium alarense TaxID=2846851 RepID=UPI001F48A10D|nr:hypothetical protein [Rhizobium alarense]MCF3641282.1 hypothetical protein [Rhizobium alarense]